jgi:hypothetical protein
MSTKDDALVDLLVACDVLESDAVRVLAYIAKRLLHGQAKYGPIVVSTDHRSFATEAMEEAADLAVYGTIGLMKIVDAEQEETRRCDSLNARARQNRTNYAVRADAAEVVGETCTTPTSTKPADWECGAV